MKADEKMDSAIAHFIDRLAVPFASCCFSQLSTLKELSLFPKLKNNKESFKKIKKIRLGKLRRFCRTVFWF